MGDKLPDLDVNVDIDADVKTDINTDIKTDIKADVKADTQLQLAGDIRVDTSKLAIVEPIRTESKLDTDSSAKLQTDLCLTLKLAELPTTCVSRPFHYELALSLFRFPLLALSLAGRDELKIDGSPQRTFTVGPRVLKIRRPARTVTVSGGGLHVRPAGSGGG